jgi:hypothetical protein
MARRVRGPFEPKRRRYRVLYSKHYTPLPDKVLFHIHHIKFQRHGGTDDPHNLVKLTPEEHRALHNKEDLKLRTENGRKVLRRKGYAASLAKRQNEIHRHQVGDKAYREHYRKLANARWGKYRKENAAK